MALLLASAGLAAADSVAIARHAVEQPSQALGDALRAIARQTGVSVLFDPVAVSGRTSRPVSGRLTAAEAIARALEGTGLTAEVMPDGAVVVRPVSTVLPQQQGQSAPLQVVQTEQAAGAADASPAAGDARELRRIEVTGSRLKRVEVEGPAPVNVYSREDIDRSGQTSLERFLASLNEVSVSAGEGSAGSTLGQGTVQLRGLPLGSTLVLVNGRRVQAVGSSGANFFNLNLIPLAAVERVEIVPVGSSAVYGGDALAGVVNVILKKHIDGFAFTARLGGGSGTRDGSVSLATGGESEDGSYLLLGSYGKTTPLTMAERGFFRDADYRRFGGPDTRVRNCTPGTVSSLSGGNLPGLGASFAGIPVAPQPLRVSDFEATAGQANLCSLRANGNGLALTFGSETLGVHAAADRRLGAGWRAFGEVTLADEKTKARDIGLTLTGVRVPASNAFNPFGEDVQVTAVLGPDNGLQGFERRTKFTRALVGVRGALTADWEAEVTASTTRDRGNSRTFNASVDPVARAAALASASPADALNPFTTGRAASDAVLRSIWSDTQRQSRGSKDQLGAFVRGNLLSLPAGPLETIVGAEFARDAYDVSIPGVVEIHDERRASAAYGELRVPLLHAGGLGRDGWSLASLTLAGRRDRYSDFGSASTYQAGLEVRPTRGLLLRASTATSFKPPTLLQTNVDEFSFPAELFGLTDPARGGEAVASGEVVRGTNPALGPERGRAFALGAVWEPVERSGLRLGVTHWRVKINSLIGILPAQTALDQEGSFPGFVSRGPSTDGRPGPVTRVLISEVNYGRVDTAGTDLEALFGWRSSLGKWSASVGATRTSEYGVALTPGVAEEDRLGRRFEDFWAPRWKGRLALGFERGGWNLGLTSRYLGAYKDTGPGERRLGNQWMFDLVGGVDLKAMGLISGQGISAASVSLAVVNVTDRQPQFVASSPYYDVTQADWRGRYASLRLSVDW